MEDALKQGEKMVMVLTGIAFSSFGFFFSYLNVHDFDLFFIPIIVSGVACCAIAIPIEAWAFRHIRVATFSENRHWVCGTIPSFLDYAGYGWASLSICMLIVFLVITVGLVYGVVESGLFHKFW